MLACAHPSVTGASDAPYRVEVDEGVACRLEPATVSRIVGGIGIVAMRCTTADRLWYATSEWGRDRRVVWSVELKDGGRVIEDASGMIIGAGGAGMVTRGSPSPKPETAPEQP